MILMDDARPDGIFLFERLNRWHVIPWLYIKLFYVAAFLFVHVLEWYVAGNNE